VMGHSQNRLRVARHLQSRKCVHNDATMPHKVTIQVQVNGAQPVRPLKPLGLFFLEMRSRIGIGKRSKFRSSLSPENLHEVFPSESKRVRD